MDYHTTDPPPTSPLPTSPPSEISSPKSKLEVIDDLVEVILNAIKDGKSVTAANKKKIIQAAEEIRAAVQSTNNLTGEGLERVASPTTNINAGWKNDIIEVVRTEMAELKKQLVVSPPLPTALPTTSYASKARTPATHHTYTTSTPLVHKPPPPVSKPSIIITSKKNVTSATETLQTWKKVVTFRDTNFTPSAVKFVSNNKLRVEFDSPDHLKRTFQKIGDSNPEISAEESRKLRPMIVLKGLSTDIDTSELTEIIVAQNDCIKSNIKDNDDFKFRFKRNNKNPKLYNAIFIVTPLIWKAVTQHERLNVDHQRVHVEEFCPTLQCYRCLRFGHTRKVCKSEEPCCSHCSGSHEYKECPVAKDSSKAVCLNCKESNARKNGQSGQSGESSSDMKHSATSDFCPRKQAMAGRTRLRVDYGP